ncbi:hypothetical protein O3P69_006953 [Scylla paramamosain]|uniref:Uncharacterized protein n=1 Tax=Scylla paramamosain TaxID=85552 RepID=A0AAW0V1S2_SCYPA
MMSCDGSLYPVFMDTAIEKALFKNTVPVTNSIGSRNAPSAALVVCGLGTVMAAHCKLPGQCVAVCHMVQSILWTGILEVDDKSVIVVTVTILCECVCAADSELEDHHHHHQRPTTPRICYVEKSLGSGASETGTCGAPAINVQGEAVVVGVLAAACHTCAAPVGARGHARSTALQEAMIDPVRRGSAGGGAGAGGRGCGRGGGIRSGRATVVIQGTDQGRNPSPTLPRPLPTIAYPLPAPYPVPPAEDTTTTTTTTTTTIITTAIVTTAYTLLCPPSRRYHATLLTTTITPTITTTTINPSFPKTPILLQPFTKPSENFPNISRRLTTPNHIPTTSTPCTTNPPPTSPSTLTCLPLQETLPHLTPHHHRHRPAPALSYILALPLYPDEVVACDRATCKD